MTGNPVGWFEIYVQDMSRAKGFYESVFKVELKRLPVDGLQMWSFPTDPEGKGSSGALVSMPGLPSGGNSTLVYFTSEDCSIEGARVAGAGGRVQRDRMSIGEYGFVVLAFDTEGNMFGIHSLR
ncbi:MAG TPA: VOC family protein [Gemmatimonadaceae bacterium]|nr:VOC family protein [Gemmatimonadaceae bacterium]